MTLFSEGIASHYLLIHLIRELEISGVLTSTKVDEVLQKAIDHASKEVDGCYEAISQPDEMQELEIEKQSVEKAIEILKSDVDKLCNARTRS
jgi:hypothetical protein